MMGKWSEFHFQSNLAIVQVACWTGYMALKSLYTYLRHTNAGESENHIIATRPFLHEAHLCLFVGSWRSLVNIYPDEWTKSSWAQPDPRSSILISDP